MKCQKRECNEEGTTTFVIRLHLLQDSTGYNETKLSLCEKCREGIIDWIKNWGEIKEVK